MIISLIVAHGLRREMGYKGKLPWKIPSDLKRFKSLTMGSPIIMGRKTFDSINQRPLPGRPNLVISKNHKKEIEKNCSENVLCFSSLELALNWARENSYQECFIIGGAQIFDRTLDLAQKIYITVIDYLGPSDTYFPPYDHLNYKISLEEKWKKKEKDQYSSYFKILEKKI